jgi:hypothetical protein
MQAQLHDRLCAILNLCVGYAIISNLYRQPNIRLCKPKPLRLFNVKYRTRVTSFSSCFMFCFLRTTFRKCTDNWRWNQYVLLQVSIAKMLYWFWWYYIWKSWLKFVRMWFWRVSFDPNPCLRFEDLNYGFPGYDITFRHFAGTLYQTSCWRKTGDSNVKYNRCFSEA